MDTKKNVSSELVDHGFRTVFGSGLFLSLAITALFFSIVTTIKAIISVVGSFAIGNFLSIFELLFPILTIIGTVGLFYVYAGTKSYDFDRYLSGLRKLKCFTAMIIITLVVLYIASVAVIVIGAVVAALGDLAIDALPDIPGIDIGDLDIGGFGFGGTTISGILSGSFSLIAGIVIIVGLIMLAATVVCTIYRRGITNLIDTAIYPDIVKTRKFKVSALLIVYGYIIAAFVILSAFFSAVNAIIVTISTVLSLLEGLSLGAMFILLSLCVTMFRSGFDQDKKIPRRKCPKCGTFVVKGAEFCMKCGQSLIENDESSQGKKTDPSASASSSAPIVTQIITTPYDPVAPYDPIRINGSPTQPSQTDSEISTADKPSEPANSESESVPESITKDEDTEINASDTATAAFCTACGHPVDTSSQKFCPNCGAKVG